MSDACISAKNMLDTISPKKRWFLNKTRKINPRHMISSVIGGIIAMLIRDKWKGISSNSSSINVSFNVGGANIAYKLSNPYINK
ncbi:hypothetical protein SASK175_06820 [Staphylococcus argenteus]